MKIYNYVNITNAMKIIDSIKMIISTINFMRMIILEKVIYGSWFF